jgi:hypothetical protein
VFPFSLPIEAATIPIALMAYRSDRRGVKPITPLALLRSFSAIGSPCAAFHHGPELEEAPLRGRRYVCSLTFSSPDEMGAQPRGRFLEKGA